jgi:dihydroneopterin aldolase
MMAALATIELTDLVIETRIGTYGPDAVVPREHRLDLILGIDPSLVLIAEDGMQHVFDYDPLVAEIDQLARDGHYDTQERLMTRIVGACAAYREIEAIEIFLRKTPVLNGSGDLGVRLRLDGSDMAGQRNALAAEAG